MKPPKSELLLPIVAQNFAQRLKLPSPSEETLNLNTEDLLERIKTNPECYIPALAERFLWENLEGSSYGVGVLKALLEEFSSLKGYLFKFEGKPELKQYTFFCLGTFYFYPLLFGSSKELFLALWQKNIPFRAIFSELKDLPEEGDLAELFEALDRLRLTRITTKTRNKLAPIIELQKRLGRLKFDEAPTSEELHFVVSAEPLPEERLNEALAYRVVDRELAPRLNLYVISAKDSAKLHSELEELESNEIGIAPASKLVESPFNRFSPLLLAISALEHARRAGLRVKVVDGFSLHVLGDLLYELEDLGSAKEVYEIAKDYTLQPIELALSLSSIYYILKDYDAAEKVLRGKLCGCIKEDPMVHHNLGLVYLAKGDKDYAEYHLYKAYLLEPDNEIIRARLVEYLFDAGKIEEIVEILKDKENLHPKESLILGKIYFRQKDFEKAFQYLSSLLDKPDRDGEASLYLAWLYLNLRKNEDVGKIFFEEAREKLLAEDYERIVKELNLWS